MGNSYELFLSTHACIFFIQNYLLYSYYIPDNIVISWARETSNI